MKRALFPLMVLAFLAGCASDEHATLQEINRPETSLLFGYMDMSGAPSKMNYFDMKNLPGYEKTYDFEVDNGLFYNAAVPLGSYQLNEFGGTSTLFLFFFPTFHRYTFLNPDAQFRIAKPSMYYLGSFKYEKDKDSFTITRIKTPTEAELLQRLYPKVQGTKWEAVVLNRLRSLGVRDAGN